METVTATLEWHYYCPKCERSCLTRFSGSDKSWRTTCSDCGTKYEVRPTPLAPDGADVCHIVTHVFIDGTCAECGVPEPRPAGKA